MPSEGFEPAIPAISGHRPTPYTARPPGSVRKNLTTTNLQHRLDPNIFNPLIPKLFSKLFMTSVRTSKRTTVFHYENQLVDAV
jgi:hypothetical protein